MKLRLPPDRPLCRLLVCSLLLWSTSPARAWNPTGHMIIASLAYDQLPPAPRARWVALLQAHPAFDQWQAAAPKDAPDLDFGRYLFMRASTWPDDIRQSGSPWDHPPWHHVDYPLREPAGEMQPPPADVPNALSAIDLCAKTVSDPASSAADRAASLSWLIHLIGDLQQPLHCANRLSATFPAPEGDRNGGLLWVSVAGDPISLHWLWDCLPGNTRDFREITARGRQLAGEFPRAALPELTTATDPKSWSLEGRTLAISLAYGGNFQEGGKEAKTALPLPDGYLNAARSLANRRVALAGYRLADTLSALNP